MTGGDSISYWLHSQHCEVNCGTNWPNTEEIWVRLQRKASVISVTSFGPFVCSGTLPQLLAYDVSGNLLDSEPMQVTDPPDCAAGGDDMSNHLNGGVSDPDGRIDHLIITPPSPWQWTIPDGTGGTLPARALIDYTVRIMAPAPPPPVPDSLCPPTGDPVWDSLSVRQAAFAIFDSSGAMTRPSGEATEYAFAVHRNPDGSFRISSPPQLHDVCTVNLIVLPSYYADSTLVAIFHVHTAEDRQVLTCPKGEPFPIYNPFPGNGLSGGDALVMIEIAFARTGMNPQMIGLYVIDKEWIWKNPPTNAAGEYFNQGHREPRRPASCRWL